MIFVDQKQFEDDISITFDRFRSINYFIIKKIVKTKVLVVGKILADDKLIVFSNFFSVDKDLEDTKYLVFIMNIWCDISARSDN